MKPFKEVIDGIRKAVMASEVREDIAQMGEYVEQFANTAGENIQKAIDPTLTVSGKAADAAKVGEAVNAEAERAKAAEEENAQGIGQLKEDIGDYSYSKKFGLSTRSVIDINITPRKGDLIFFRADENESQMFLSANLFLYYSENDYKTITLRNIGEYSIFVADKDYIKIRINNELSQVDASEPKWSATFMSSGEHNISGNLMWLYSLLDNRIELRKTDIENLKNVLISKNSNRFAVSKTNNNTYLNFPVISGDKGFAFVSDTNASNFTAYDLYGHKTDNTFELIKRNITSIGSVYTYENNKGYDYIRIIFKCSAPSTEDEYIDAIFTSDTEVTAYGFITKLVEDVDNLKETKVESKPHAYMPDVIYCALGRTIDIYNNQVCIDADKYHLCWTCNIGFGEGRRFTVTPDAIGDYSLKLDIYNDNNELVWTKTSKLKVVSAKTSGSVTILPIGDSMTYGGATWQDEVSNKLSNGAITYVGSLEHDYRGIKYNHEGYNGATASNFLNSEMLRGLTNPFYNRDTSKFDWNHYKNNTGISPDVVQIELGTNDINGGTIEQAVSNIAEMVDLIREDDASIPIFICNAIYRSNQDGIAHQLSTQGYSMGNGVYKYGEDIKIQSLMVGLAERLADYENVYFIPLALCHDSENNFGKQEIPLNSRSQETITIPADSIHPNKTGEDSSIYGYDIVGYLQFADVMYSTLCGVLPTLN